MAKGLAVGVKVCASSKAVIGERAAKARYGAGWKNKLAYGIINEQVGFGRSRKWRISFSSLNKVVDLSARALTVVVESESEEDVGGLVATSSSADDTANAEARDEVNEIEDGEDHLGEWEAFDADDNDGQPEIDNDGNDSEQRSENVIVCQGVEWHICDCVSDDVRIQPRFSAKLLWVDDCCAAERIPIQYFKMSFPTQMVPDILMWSGMAMPIKKKKMDEAEFWRLLGIIYTLTRTTSKRRDLWSLQDGIFPAPRFGSRYGISRQRFEVLLRYLRFCPPEEFESTQDRWAPVRRLVDGFNKRRVETFYPSWSICVDESISAWRGKDGNYCSDGMPHVTKIKRKPKGVGAELKDAACSQTQVIIALEIQEGKEEMATKKYMQEWKKAGTAQVLRLTEPWHGSGRVINADSAFASVTTAEACRKYGLHFTGLVKTATTKFPMKYFNDLEYNEPGDHHVLTATINGHSYIACGWMDSTRKHFISTHNTTLEGNPHGKRRWREVESEEHEGTEVYFHYTKRPKLVEHYFDSAKIIDVHNHARQSGLSLETAWGTQRWDHRVLSTLLGIIETDAYHMWYSFHPKGKKWLHADFTEDIAEALLKTSTDTRRLSASSDTSDVDLSNAGGLPHEFRPLKELPQYLKSVSTNSGHRALRRCSVCSSLASYFCTICSNVEHGQIVSICGLSSKRGSSCLVRHIV